MIILTPWDTKALDVDCYEILNPTLEDYQISNAQLGHYTVKIDPLADRELLHKNGFYYCDTLITPYCKKESFNPFIDTNVGFKKIKSFGDLKSLEFSRFIHGRFHKDFNVSVDKADRRYTLWLESLTENNCVYLIQYGSVNVGFIAVNGSHLLLHAISEEYKGKGLAKYLWTPLCNKLLEENSEITSQISASNLPVLNLYASLGFKFRNVVDVYHKFTIGSDLYS